MPHDNNRGYLCLSKAPAKPPRVWSHLILSGPSDHQPHLVGDATGGGKFKVALTLPANESDRSPGSMHETGCSGPGPWDDPEGWDREGGGRRAQDGNTCTPMADSCQCMVKTTTIL